MWNTFVMITIVLVVGLIFYNIYSLIKKMKLNPRNTWMDLIIGVIIFGAAATGLIVLFIRMATGVVVY